MRRTNGGEATFIAAFSALRWSGWTNEGEENAPLTGKWRPFPVDRRRFEIDVMAGTDRGIRRGCRRGTS